ncbi:hypothetical protein WR25_11204 [Diploscapter pachys]|uniref:Uncharacterized protein n=1 Tax=Diploscapter pachys TaxID=2018661 RepID=A0A2A2LU79_9BILA|nr:hypothetical protein WR25_11204 [Diploscapter pachys]
MSEDLRTIRTENDPLLTDDATRIRTLQSSESTLENPERTSSGTTEKATNRSTEALHSPDTSATPISLLLGPPPKDCFSLVYMITFVQGIAIFLPVNMSITIAPSYYSKYWWTLNGTTTTPYETNFMTIISCSVNGITYGLEIIEVATLNKII